MTNIHSYEQEIKNLETQIDGIFSCSVWFLGKQNTFKNQIYQTIVLDLYEVFLSWMINVFAFCRHSRNWCQPLKLKRRTESSRWGERTWCTAFFKHLNSSRNNASTRPLPLIPVFFFSFFVMCCRFPKVMRKTSFWIRWVRRRPVDCFEKAVRFKYTSFQVVIIRINWLLKSKQFSIQFSSHFHRCRQLERHIIEISEMTVQLSQHVCTNSDSKTL